MPPTAGFGAQAAEAYEERELELTGNNDLFYDI